MMVNLSRIFAFILLGLSSSCSMIGEKEHAAQTVKLNQKGPKCEIPNVFLLFVEDTLDLKDIDQFTDCLQQNIDRAFDSIEGKTSDELNIEEIAVLYKHGFFKTTEGIDLSLHWPIIGEILSLLHSNGQKALQRKTLENFVEITRSGKNTLFIGSRGEWKVFTAQKLQEVISFFGRYIELFGSKGQITIDSLTKSVENSDNCQGDVKIDATCINSKNQIKALWNLKSLIFPDIAVDDNLKSDSIVSFLSLIKRTLAGAPDIILWILRDYDVNLVPSTLDDEIKRSINEFQNYFEIPAIQSIDLEIAKWSTQTLLNSPNAANLVPEIARIIQRLNPIQFQNGPALHMKGFPTLLSGLNTLSERISKAKQEFLPLGESQRLLSESESKSFYSEKSLNSDIVPEEQYNEIISPSYREISLRDVKQRSQFLKENLFFNPIYVQPSKTDSNRISPLNTTLSWSEIVQQLIESSLVGQIFKTFDENADGEINYLRDNAKETESIDLSFSFIRLVSILSEKASKKSENSKDEIALEEPLLIKPSAVYQSMGILGDRWLLSGDKNGTLNGREFYILAKLYVNFLETSDYIFSEIFSKKVNEQDNTELFSPQKNRGEYIFDFPTSEILFERRNFLENLNTEISAIFNGFGHALRSIPNEQFLSLLHSLIGVPKDEIEVFPIKESFVDSEGKQTLSRYVTKSSMTPPIVVIDLLNRLQVICDHNDDGLFSWNELDCALPLLIETAHIAVESKLFDFKPLVNDGLRILLSTLSHPGLPLSVGKTIVYLGTFRDLDKVDLDQLLTTSQRILDTVELDWEDVARFIGPSDRGSDPKELLPWKIEAKNKFGDCDFDGNSTLSGKEIECIVQRISTSTHEFIQNVAKKILDSYQTKHPLPLALLGDLGIVEKMILLELCYLSEGNNLDELIQVNPANIMKVLEEATRRAVPL